MRLGLLFGSQATGKATALSDVDVAVDAPGVDVVDLAAELARALGREVDVVQLSEAGYPLLKRLLHEAVVVYEATPGAAAGWRAHAIATTETDRPWFERMRDAYLKRLASRVAV